MKIPPDPEEQNEERAKWARVALTSFRIATRSEACDALVDLLCDLMHWCDRNDTDFANELRIAKNHYTEETDRAGKQALHFEILASVEAER